ncbi:alpha-ketoglutarate-dependent dioxygenase AlkB [Polymorphobacter fuscus]|uniref:Alpha-ketoglutarate-dependent dioxygenase AlkB n=2 Tax=Sandarakinorhabdus fusca TaxID=1439888 RepID=A0A7C9KGK3_9SPHN|nr:alpha-ketoglutarate-dependent dioxygenase AlkB [Polymorphobacter fuscus]KAB7649077.1 alpha-ketoglutarate-dependent dioxygenase AlkB [Polymorphobacter fuscus]MQT16160.1 alpha-ketoglutarate-dependent dioxygenase AlkB [Polymorphobacter fuscus]
MAFAEDLVSQSEEVALITAIGSIALSPFRFHGWLGNRQTASFGWLYDFETGAFDRATPIPSAFLPLRARAAAFAGLAADDLVQLLVTRYDPGAGIGWHRDRPVFEHVVGISLGAPAAMRFRRRTATGFARHSLPLQPRSAYRLSGEARHDWEHSIAEMTTTRWSLTFRSLAGDPNVMRQNGL